VISFSGGTANVGVGYGVDFALPQWEGQSQTVTSLIINTTSSAANRSADVVTLTGSALTAAINCVNNVGTIRTRATVPVQPSGTYPTLWTIDDGSSANQVFQYYLGGTSNINFKNIIQYNGIIDTTCSLTAFNSGTIDTVVSFTGALPLVAALSGSTGVAGVINTVFQPFAATSAFLGVTSHGGLAWLNGYIAEFDIWPTTFSQNTITAMASGAAQSLAAIDLNFLTQSYLSSGNYTALSSLINVSNSTGGSVTFSNGSITYIGANTARISDLGLLVETVSSNIIYNSTLLNAPGGSGMTVTNNSPYAPAPDGTYTASEVVFTNFSSGYTHNTGTTLNLTAGTTYACSFYIKPINNIITNAGGYFMMTFGDATSTNDYGPVIRLPDMSVQFSSNSSTGAANTVVQAPVVTQYANGWYRVTWAFTLGVSVSSGDFTLGGYVSGGTGKGNCLIWGMQVEVASSCSSYIPSSGSPGSRQPDLITLTGAALAAAQSTTLTVRASGIIYSPTPVNGNTLLGGTTASSGNRLYANANNQVNWFVGPTNIVATAASGTWNTGGTIAVTLRPGFAGNSFNGSGPQSKTTSYYPFTGTVYLGCLDGSNGYFKGYITELTIWTTSFPNGELQYLTSGNGLVNDLSTTAYTPQVGTVRYNTGLAIGQVWNGTAWINWTGPNSSVTATTFQGQAIGYAIALGGL
jgi:hypothetical protein